MEICTYNSKADILREMKDTGFEVSLMEKVGLRVLCFFLILYFSLVLLFLVDDYSFWL